MDKIKKALDHAEGRLLTIDALHNPAVANNSDVIETIREAQAEVMRIRSLTIYDLIPD